jgi:hypothetical protein
MCERAVGGGVSLRVGMHVRELEMDPWLCAPSPASPRPFPQGSIVNSLQQADVLRHDFAYFGKPSMLAGDSGTPIILTEEEKGYGLP